MDFHTFIMLLLGSGGWAFEDLSWRWRWRGVVPSVFVLGSVSLSWKVWRIMTTSSQRWEIRRVVPRPLGREVRGIMSPPRYSWTLRWVMAHSVSVRTKQRNIRYTLYAIMILIRIRTKEERTVTFYLMWTPEFLGDLALLIRHELEWVRHFSIYIQSTVPKFRVSKIFFLYIN